MEIIYDYAKEEDALGINYVSAIVGKKHIVIYYQKSI